MTPHPTLRALAVTTVAVWVAAVGLGAPASAADTGNRFQTGLYAGVGPTEPLYVQPFGGGFVDVPLGERWALELSGSWQGGLAQRKSLFDFLEENELLDPDDAVADRAAWTAEATVRVSALRGKLAALQTTLGTAILGLGFGGGVRANESAGGDAAGLAPVGLAVAAVDFLPGERWLVRTEARLVGQQRRDASFGCLGEFLLGVGVRL